MNDSKKEKYIIGLLIIVILIILIIITLLLIKPKKSNNSNNAKYEKIDSKQNTIYMQKGNEYMTNAKSKDGNVVISFSYPVINIKTESVDKLNEEIKKLYTDSEKSLLDNLKDSNGCTCITVDGSEKCSKFALGYIDSNLETDKLVNLKIYSSSISVCENSTYELSKSYFVSKITGKKLNNSEVVKSFNYNPNKLVQAYNNYIKKLKTKDNTKNYKSITSVNELKLILTQKKSIQLSILGPGLGHGDIFELQFDGTTVTNPDEVRE